MTRSHKKTGKIEHITKSPEQGDSVHRDSNPFFQHSKETNIISNEQEVLKVRYSELKKRIRQVRHLEKRRESEISALLAGARAVLQYQAFSDSARIIFDNCKRMLGAESGYVALLSEDGQKNEVLFLDSGDQSCSVDPLLPMPIRGFRNEVYRRGKVKYCNNFSGTSWVKYLPEGHVHLNNVLFAPLVLEGKVVGLLGLANKEGGFDRRDARVAATFGELVAVALKNNRTLDLLKSSESELSAILSNIPILTLVLDSERRIVKVNKAVTSFAGRKLEEIVGQRSGGVLGCLNSSDDPRGCGFGQSCQACLLRLSAIDTLETGNSHYEVEWQTVIGRDGKGDQMTFLVSTVLLSTSGRELLICLEDITERKKTDRIKDDFIGMVSHELRTPLTIVIGSIRTAINEGVSREDVHSLLENATVSADSLALILDNLLELSRYQAKRLVLKVEPVKLNKIVTTLVNRHGEQSPAHRFVVDIPADLPPVAADAIRVEQILRNLIDNAVKYSPNGGEVVVSARRDDQSVIVSVRDEGVGISQEDQMKLFTPFQRLELTRSAMQGVGLGLVVCQRLVEAHNGRIWIESSPGKGSTFYFTLPAQDRAG